MGVHEQRAWVSQTEGIHALYPRRDQKGGPLLGAGTARKKLDIPAPPCKVNYMSRQPEQPITEVLRRAIIASGKAFKALERETGVLRQSLMKFSRGQQT